MYETDKSTLDAGLKMLEQELESIKKYQRFVAELMGNYYRSLIWSGFSAEQALLIVIAHGALLSHTPNCTECDFDVGIYDFFDDDGSTDLI